MKYYKFFIVIALLLILSGCNARELEFNRSYPDMAKLDEMRAKIEEERKKDPEYLKYAYLIDSDTQPVNLALYSVKKSDIIIDLTATEFCWKENIFDCPNFNADPVKILKDSNLEIPELSARKRTNFSVQIFDSSSTIPPASRLEFTGYDENYNYLPMSIWQSSNQSYELEVPNEEGTYYYVIKAFFDNLVEGVAYFPFKIVSTQYD